MDAAFDTRSVKQRRTAPTAYEAVASPGRHRKRIPLRAGLQGGDWAPEARCTGSATPAPTPRSGALCLYTPPGYEQYFRDVHAAVAAGEDLTVDLLAELRSHYATESR